MTRARATLLGGLIVLRGHLSCAAVWHLAFSELHTRANSSTLAGSDNSSSSPKGVISINSPAATQDNHGNDALENWRLANGLMYAWLAMSLALMAYLLFINLRKYIRLVSCLNNTSQRYFSRPNRYFSAFKKYLLDAPLLQTRHSRELKLSKALTVGTLPSRAEFLFLVCYIGAILFLTFFHVDYTQPHVQVLSHLTKKTGLQAIVNMIPLFLFAGRNNILLFWTGMSFDTFNLLHRWIGRTVIFEACLHMTVYLVRKVEAGGWEAYRDSLAKSKFILCGSIGAFTFIAILLTSARPFRKAFYETFLHIHQLLAMLALGSVYFHMNEYAPQQDILKWVIAIWVVERSWRIVRLLYRNVGITCSQAEVTALECDVVRLKVRLARSWKFRPGQHAYIYMPGVGFWTSHPFSVAWSDEDDEEVASDKESLPKAQKDMTYRRHCNLYFLIKAQSGFTQKLWTKASEAPSGCITTRAFLEGPYSSQKLDSYGTVILFAAGIGITHQVAHVRELVRGYTEGTVATRRVTLVWIIRTEKHLEWIRDWMTPILQLPRCRECLKVLIFITRPEKQSHEYFSPSSSVQVFPGRPSFQAIVDQEVGQSIGAIGVTVCGPGGVADQVRASCREWMGKVEIDFEEESFSW